MSEPALLHVDKLNVSFHSPYTKEVVRAVKNVSFSVKSGEVFGLAGESGSGKTTVAKAIVRLQRTDSGSICYRGRQINRRLSREARLDYIRQVQMIFQDPVASINDRAKVFDVLNEGLRNIEKSLPASRRRERIAEMLLEVGLSPDDMDRYSHTFSGGQLQRIGIARALLMEPQLVVADEPVSALDLSVRGQILKMMAELKEKHHLTYLFIGHDLSLMRYFCDRIAIMCAGTLVELGAAEQLFRRPAHPYTQALLSAIPVPNPAVERQRTVFTYQVDRRGLGGELAEIEPGHFVLDQNNMI